MKLSHLLPGIRPTLCLLSLSCIAYAQCPSGGYPPPGPPPRINNPVGPPSSGGGQPAEPSGPTTPNPAGPSAPGPGGPRTGGPKGPPTGGATPLRPRTGGPRGMPITLDRGHTSKRRLTVEWLHPVPPRRDDGHTAAAGPMTHKDAIAHLWEADDGRPLMVLRECQSCQGSDSALLSRSLKNDKTMLLTKWFRTVKLPAHIGERTHPFHNVFAGYNFGKKMPHFFLLADKDAQPVAFSGVQTQSGLWKAMYNVLEQRYAKSPKRQVKKWLMLLDRYDTLEGRRTSLKEELLAVRSTKGPDSSKAKKLRKKLDEISEDWAKVEAEEKKVRNLGLLKAPTKIVANVK